MEVEKIDYSLPIKNKLAKLVPSFGEPFSFTGDYEVDRDTYLAKAVQAIKMLPIQDFQLWLTQNGRSFPGGTTGYFFIRRSETDENVIVNLDCAVNTGMFNVYGEDFTSLIPIVIFHEVQESWQVASRFKYPERQSENAHFEARVTELIYAIRHNLDETYFKWIDKIGVPAHYQEELEKAHARALELLAV